MNKEMLKKQLEDIKAKLNEAFKKMLESASDEDVKKYENLCALAKKIEEQIKEIETLEERNDGNDGNPDHLDEGANNLSESVRFINSLREAVAKGSTFTGLIPRDVASQIQMKKEKLSKLRGYCTVHQATGDYTVYIEGDDATVSYVGEGTALTETSPSIKPIGLSALKLGCLVKVSNEYINDLAVDVMAYLVDKISRAFAKKEDHEILFGAGTSSSKTNIRGIDKNTDVSSVTTASATAITWTEVKKAIQALKDYRDNAILVMNATTRDAIHEFKDGDKYIFDQNIELKQILGCSIVLSSDMPSIGAGNTIIIAGDFSYYHLMDRESLQMKTLLERYADTDQVGITAIERIDGDIALGEAFSKLVCKASA